MFDILNILTAWKPFGQVVYVAGPAGPPMVLDKSGAFLPGVCRAGYSTVIVSAGFNAPDSERSQ